MSEALGERRDREPPAPLRAGALARWLAPTAESRLERIPCASVAQRAWPPAEGGDGLVALVRSIRERGIVEPLLLRPEGPGRFQVVLGARRLEAALRAGLTEVPAIVRQLDDAEATLVAAWSLLPRVRSGEMVEVAARLAASGVAEAEIALLLGMTPPAPVVPEPEWPLLSDSAPLRFTGARSPLTLLLRALGGRREAAFAALDAACPLLVAGAARP